MAEALSQNAVAVGDAAPRATRAVAPVGVAVAGAAFALVAGMSFVGGGYFPRSWGWASLGLLWVVGAVLGTARALELRRRETALLAAFLVLLGLTLLSGVWTSDSGQAMVEAQRILLYTAGVAAVLVLHRRLAGPVLVGVLAGVVAAAAYGLATRVFPDRLGTFDPIGIYRLGEPLGYWNAVGILTVIGLLLALAFSARMPAPIARGLVALTVPVLATTLYFTFSRGAWIASGAGLVFTFALDRRRLQLLAAALAAAPWAAASVYLGSQQDALTLLDSPLAVATEQGHRLAAWVGLLSLGAGVSAAAVAIAQRRLALPPRAHRSTGAVALVAVAVGIVALFVRFGAPWTIAANAYESFTAPVRQERVVDLNARLWTFYGNGRPQLWSVAWDAFAAAPIGGQGAGSYEQSWLRERPIVFKVRDAHSLYLEVLAELGVAGLALLLAALAVPVWAATRARAHPLVPAAGGAYVAYLAHAGVDWHWEMPAATLTALVVGAAVVVAARPQNEPRPLPGRARYAALAGVVALSAAAFVGLVGNMALAESARAAAAADWDRALDQARKAERWAPWSSEPWKRMGGAHLARGEVEQARAAFLRAIEKAPNDWSRWLDLARATTGDEQRRALAEATRLNPLSPEVARFRAEITGETVTAVEEIGKD